jgi:hypothetical protein
MALEAIILNRLDCIPKARRQEWLRGLLVQGFSSECLVLRGVPEKRERGSAMAFTQWLAGEPPSPQPRSPQVQVDGKPFAALGKVIG